MPFSQSMSEQELLSDLLTQEKTLIKEYAGAITESSCDNLRRLLLNNMTECSCDQLSVFRQMQQRNFYKTKDAPDSEVQTAKQEMEQLKQQTGFQG